MCIDWVSKVGLDKIDRCLSVWRQKKKTQNKTKLSQNRSSDHMMTSDWLVDVSNDRYTTSIYIWFRKILTMIYSGKYKKLDMPSVYYNIFTSHTNFVSYCLFYFIIFFQWFHTTFWRVQKLGVPMDEHISWFNIKVYKILRMDVSKTLSNM